MEVKHLGIGIHGKKFSGKSEVSNLIQQLIFKWRNDLPLQEKLHYFIVHEMAFADDVKKISEKLMYSALLRQEMSCVISEKKEEFLSEINKTPREIWKIVGEMGRQIDPDLWVKKVFDEINRILKMKFTNPLNRCPVKSEIFSTQEENMNHIFLIDDVRRTNEYEALKNHDFLIFRILGKNGSNDQHPTETDLDHLTDDYFQAVIHNENKNLEYLTSQVQEIFSNLIKPKLNQMIGC